MLLYLVAYYEEFDDAIDLFFYIDIKSFCILCNKKTLSFRSEHMKASDVF